MEYVNLGRTGLKVSRICLGCMTYGRPPAPDEPKAGRHLWAMNEQESQPFLRQALDLNSKQTWGYEGNNHYNNESQNPADGNPRTFFDEAHAFLKGAPLPPGGKIRLHVQRPERFRHRVLAQDPLPIAGQAVPANLERHPLSEVARIRVELPRGRQAAQRRNRSRHGTIREFAR